jgi:hypothetical protein
MVVGTNIWLLEQKLIVVRTNIWLWEQIHGCGNNKNMVVGTKTYGYGNKYMVVGTKTYYCGNKYMFVGTNPWLWEQQKIYGCRNKKTMVVGTK